MTNQLSLDFRGETSTEQHLERVLMDSHAPLGGKTGVIPCGYCGALIRRKRHHQKYCSDACRSASWKEKAEDAEAEKDRLKALAAAKCREEATIARWAALVVLGRYGVCTVSHVREYLEERGIHLSWERNWPGSLFQHPWFEPTGRRKMAFHAEANARKVNEYRLSAEGRKAKSAIALLLAPSWKSAKRT